jgi:hypothetical protein
MWRIFGFPVRGEALLSRRTRTGGWSVKLFRAEKVGELESISTKKCRACGERLVLVRGILDASTGEMIQMFECDCGERIWEN